jgi:hypothetical protein
MPCPSQSSWFDDTNNIWSGVHIIKLLVMQFSSLPCYKAFFPLTTKN